MPADEDIDAAVAKDSDNARMQGREAIASAVPEPEEPLKESVVNALGELIGPAIERLTKGQMPAPPWTPVQGDQETVPMELAEPVMALGAMTQSLMDKLPEIADYAFDAPAMLTTNAGLTEVGSLIDSMSRDKALIKALSAKGTAPEDEETDVETDTETEPEEPAEEE